MMHRLRYVALAPLLLLCVACGKDGVTYHGTSLSDFFLQPSGSEISYEALGVCNSTITVCVPEGTDVTDMTVKFKTNSSKVTVDGTEVTSGKSSFDFSSPVCFDVSADEGRIISYEVNVIQTNRQVLYIHTPNVVEIVSKEKWIEGTSVKIWDDGSIIEDNLDARIRCRGNATMRFPKKCFALKFDRKYALCGLPADKRWNLQANWRDITEIRNSIAFRISELSPGLQWTPRTSFVRIVLNGVDWGFYQLQENVKISKDRVNITELTTRDNEGEAVTGGYVLELDSYYDEVKQFKSETKNLPYIIKEPDQDDITDSQFNYIRNYINTVEKTLYGSDYKTMYKSYIDEDSFIDGWFVYEITGCSEPKSPHSCYVYKDRNGKLFFGPVWDFDLDTFIPDKTKFICNNAIYYGRLLKIPAFVARVKEKWNAQVDAYRSVAAYIDQIAAECRDEVIADKVRWPIIDSLVHAYNNDEYISYDEAVARIRKAYVERVECLDRLIGAL